MKHYKFLMKDKFDGSLSEGKVSAPTWQEAWSKLSPLMIGNKILDIDDLDDADEMEEEEQSNMSILHLVKPGEQPPEVVEETEQMYKITFAFLAGNPMTVLANEELKQDISSWFNGLDEEEITCTLNVSGITVCLDRMFVGALFIAKFDGEDEEDVSTIETDSTVTEGANADGNL